MLPRYPNMKSTLIRSSATCLALLLMANAASAKPNPWNKVAGLPETVLAWMKEAEAVVQARYDPIKRTIICRVSNADIVITELIQETNVSESRMMHAITRLKERRWVRVSDNAGGQGTITPATEEAREKMKRWAPYFCRDEKSDIAR